MDEEDEPRGQIVVAKVLHSAFLASVAIYVEVLVRLSSLGVVPPLANDQLLDIIGWVLAYVAAVDLGFWYFWPRLMLKAYVRNPEKRRKARDPLFIHLVRICFLQSIAIYGLVLGVLGADYKVTLPFFGVVIAMLALTFPTKARWIQMQKNVERALHDREP